MEWARSRKAKCSVSTVRGTTVRLVTGAVSVSRNTSEYTDTYQVEVK